MADYNTQKREAMIAVSEIQHIGKVLIDYGMKDHGEKILRTYGTLVNYAEQFFQILEGNGVLRDLSLASARGVIRGRVEDEIHSIRAELMAISRETSEEQVGLRRVLLPDCENAIKTLGDIIRNSEVKEQ